jgi:hypothetical protein
MTLKTGPYQRTGWILVAGLLVFYFLVATRWQALCFYDDSMYMYFGTRFRPGDFIDNLSWAPLYSLWFKGLALLLHDAVWRYMASWGLLVVLLALLPLWMRLRFGWLYAFILLVVPFFSTATYVSFFAAVFVVGGAGLLLRRPSSCSGALTLACSVCFVVAYSRPEFVYGVVLAAVATVMCLARDLLHRDTSGEAGRDAHGAGWKLAAVLAETAAVLYSKSHSDSWRSGWAFLQHYNYRAWKSGRLHEDPWGSDYAAHVFHLSAAPHFDPTIAGYFRANPALFLQHVRSNLFSPLMVVLVLAVAALAAWPWCSARSSGLRAAGLYLLFVSLPVFGSSALIYPRPHYAVIVLPALLIVALQYLPEQAPYALWPLLLCGCCLILLDSRQYRRHRPEFNTAFRRNIPAIQCLREFERANGHGDGRIYDTVMAETSAQLYLDRPASSLHLGPLPDWGSFREAMQRSRPSRIITGLETPGLYGMTEDEFTARLEHELGYAAHPCQNSSGVTVYTRGAP